MSETEATGGEIAIAAFLLFRGFFQHENTGALQVRINGGAKGCVACSGNDDIIRC